MSNDRRILIIDIIESQTKCVDTQRILFGALMLDDRIWCKISDKDTNEKSILSIMVHIVNCLDLKLN